MCQSLEQCSMGNFIHEVEGEKRKGAGTDSTQLFSIKPFMASIKFSVSVREVPLDCWCTWCSGLRGRRVFDSRTIQTGREQIRLVFSCQSPTFKLVEEDKKDEHDSKKQISNFVSEIRDKLRFFKIQGRWFKISLEQYFMVTWYQRIIEPSCFASPRTECGLWGLCVSCCKRTWWFNVNVVILRL